MGTLMVQSMLRIVSHSHHVLDFIPHFRKLDKFCNLIYNFVSQYIIKTLTLYFPGKILTDYDLSKVENLDSFKHSSCLQFTF